MTDNDFNDLNMDWDDDAFFLENSVQDCDKESISLLPSNKPAEKHKENFTSKYFESYKTISVTDTITQMSVSDNLNNKTKSIISSTNTSTEINPRALTIPDTPCSSPGLNASNFKTGASNNNNRFTPGFTPISKKRKFPGPAGLLDNFDESNDSIPEFIDSKKMLTAMDSDSEYIPGLQIYLEHLSLTSWKKLQADVSSNLSLNATSELFSIQRVLHKTSKMKLPKLTVVPVLCVFLKEFRSREPSIMSVFRDDTGEIDCKIDEDVFTNYKEYVVEGTSFVLQKVKFIFNMMILKSENIVSMYLCDGREKHLQNIKSILNTEKSPESTKCESPTSSHQIKNNLFCATGNTKTVDSHHKEAISNLSPTVINRNCNSSRNVINQNTPTMKSSAFISKPTSIPVNFKRNDEFPEDNCLDEFDELLGNIDEKSFM